MLPSFSFFRDLDLVAFERLLLFVSANDMLNLRKCSRLPAEHLDVMKRHLWRYHEQFAQETVLPFCRHVSSFLQFLSSRPVPQVPVSPVHIFVTRSAVWAKGDMSWQLVGAPRPNVPKLTACLLMELLSVVSSVRLVCHYGDTLPLEQWVGYTFYWDSYSGVGLLPRSDHVGTFIWMK